MNNARVGWDGLYRGGVARKYCFNLLEYFVGRLAFEGSESSLAAATPGLLRLSPAGIWPGTYPRLFSVLHGSCGMASVR
jgi:hypothetical protein